MKNRLLIICIILLISAAQLYSDNNQKMFPIDSEIYSYLDFIYMESGMISPFSSAPYSAEEIIFYLKEISKKNLSPSAQKAYEKIEAELNREKLYTTEGMEFNINEIVNVEGYFHTNDDKDFREHGYEDREDFLEIPMEMWIQNSLYLTSEISLREDPFVVTEEPDNSSNLPDALEFVEAHFPYRAFGSTGGKHWNLQFGRDTLDWGNAKSSNLMLSDNADYHDAVKFSAFWKSFKFTTAYINLEPWLGDKVKSGDDWVMQYVDGYDEDGDGGTDTSDYDGDDLEQKAYDLPGEDSFKAFFGHRLEFRPNNKLEIVVSESIIFGGKTPDLQYMNPLMVYHNWYIPEYANSLATIETKIKILKHTDFYFQYAMDQIQTPSEKENYASASEDPNAFGILAGIHQIVPSKKGLLDFTFEFVYTNPWLYTAESRYLSYSSRRRIMSNLSSTGTKLYRDRCLGFEYGPDTIFYYFEVNYDTLDKFKASLDIRYRITGDNGFDTPYGSVENAASLTSPSGDDPLTEFTAHIFTGFKLSESWSFSTDFYWVNYWNYGESKENIDDFEIAACVSYKF